MAFDQRAARGHMMDAAGVLWDHGSEFGENQALHDAIAAYRMVLDLAYRERVPLDWAMTQNNFGTALRTLGQRESGTARLEEAVTRTTSAPRSRRSGNARAGRCAWRKRWRPTMRLWKFFQLLTLITMKPFATPIESEH